MAVRDREGASSKQMTTETCTHAGIGKYKALAETLGACGQIALPRSQVPGPALHSSCGYFVSRN